MSIYQLRQYKYKIPYKTNCKNERRSMDERRQMDEFY